MEMSVWLVEPITEESAAINLSAEDKLRLSR
jgi:hypothetical protein